MDDDLFPELNRGLLVGLARSWAEEYPVIRKIELYHVDAQNFGCAGVSPRFAFVATVTRPPNPKGEGFENHLEKYIKYLNKWVDETISKQADPGDPVFVEKYIEYFNEWADPKRKEEAEPRDAVIETYFKRYTDYENWASDTSCMHIWQALRNTYQNRQNFNNCDWMWLTIGVGEQINVKDGPKFVVPEARCVLFDRDEPEEQVPQETVEAVERDTDSREESIWGWKGIADHIGCSVTQAKRYRSKALPIQQENTGSRVLAYSGELDSWMKKTFRKKRGRKHH